jgi:hypothetical protein
LDTWCPVGHTARHAPPPLPVKYPPPPRGRVPPPPPMGRASPPPPPSAPNLNTHRHSLSSHASTAHWALGGPPCLQSCRYGPLGAGGSSLSQGMPVQPTGRWGDLSVFSHAGTAHWALGGPLCPGMPIRTTGRWGELSVSRHAGTAHWALGGPLSLQACQYRLTGR